MLPTGAPLFDLDEVSFTVPGRSLLAPLSMTLSPARVIGLIGQNGSGKSTLLKILARQHRASGGHVRFSGTLLSAWSERGFARALAYLPQHVPPAPGMLVRELVAIGRYPWHGALGRFGVSDHAKVDEALELTGMRTLEHRLVDTLSGGEKQRAWLAMLIAQDAGCFLLDEPIAALDIAHQVEVLALIRRLSLQKKLSVVIVLHDVNMAMRYCDEIVALHSGKLIAQGPPDDVIGADALERIYGVRMVLGVHPETGRPVALPC